MKTLSEEINDIKTSKISKTAKKAALVKLGIMPHEIPFILAEVCVPQRQRKSTVQFTFGVEIECNVAPNAMQRAAIAHNVPCQYERYNHVDGRPYFKFVTDASVHGENPIECVSPILKGKAGKDLLKNVCTALNEANAYVNRSCGLHVHIGAADLSEEQYANVFANYYWLESLIDAFMAVSRRADNNQYSRSLADHIELLNADNRAQVAVAMHHSRYHKINPMSYDAHKTIEFRQHQGSTDYEKITMWVMFCGKLVAWSKEHRLTAPIDSIDDIEFLDRKEKEFFKARVAHFAAL